MTDQEMQIIEDAIRSRNDLLKIDAALDLIQNRINRLHTKYDYATKIQLLLFRMQLDIAEDTIDEALHIYPDYVELIGTQCAIYIYRNNFEKAQNSYRLALEIYNSRLKNTNTDEEKYAQLLNMLCLSRLVNNSDDTNTYFLALQKLNLDDITKQYITIVSAATQVELFQMFDIRETE
jgi:tetratricopeptide (TPR) repeat protein